MSLTPDFILNNGVSLTSAADDELVFRGPRARVAVRGFAPGLHAAFRELSNGRVSENRLVDLVQESDGPGNLPRLYFYLNHLVRKGLVVRAAHMAECRLSTLTSISEEFQFKEIPIEPETRYRLSRFAFLHRVDDELVMESPLSRARLKLHDWRAMVLVHLLNKPCRMKDIATQLPGLDVAAVHQLLSLMVGAQFVQGIDTGAELAEDHEPALQSWEFHDLLFHSRSREGRHDFPTGGTCRFLDRLEMPPALKETSSKEFVELHCPDLERLQREDPPFARVLESRSSIREYEKHPVNAEQLGEFLFRVGRVRGKFEDEIHVHDRRLRMDFAPRPYPAGGALYELEIYVAVHSCIGIDRGFFRYDALAHRLERISGESREVGLLLKGASASTGIPNENLQILFIISARFQRVAWKYSSMAYALVLKDVGVLFQTMYLAATAMHLAPCAVGCGNSDLFSKAAGTDYYTESSVGEFLLGSKTGA